MQIHPRPDDHGNQVTIKNPIKPTPLTAFDNPTAIATVIPDGAVPDALNGIAFNLPADAEHSMLAVEFDEPELTPLPGKKLSAGVITVEPDGRVWVIHPTNAFGGYKATFPKGCIEHGMSAQETAVREALEESGLLVELTAFIGDFERSTTKTRYYLARRIGGDPAAMGWESQAVSLVPHNLLLEVCSHPNDKPLIEAVLARLERAPNNLSEESKAILEEFLKREDVQAKPGLKKGLENILTGRKPKPRVPGKVNEAALPANLL